MRVWAKEVSPRASVSPSRVAGRCPLVDLHVEGSRAPISGTGTRQAPWCGPAARDYCTLVAEV